jgi:hypothetical protein
MGTFGVPLPFHGEAAVVIIVPMIKPRMCSKGYPAMLGSTSTQYKGTLHSMEPLGMLLKLIGIAFSFLFLRERHQKI